MADAAFEDGDEQALRLKAETEDDVTVISALLQDGVCKVANANWAPRRRRFSLLVYRFRWEDRYRAQREGRAFERVAAALTFDDVMAVKATGVDPKDGERVLNILSLNFAEGPDGGGALELVCSGGAALKLSVECVNVELVDLTRPWVASGQPQHSD